MITSLAANAAWLSVFCTVAQFCICCCLIGRGFSVADKSSATRERVRTRTLNRLSPSVTGTRLARARGVRFIASDSGCSGQVHIEKLLLLLLLLLCKSRTQFECFEIKCIPSCSKHTLDAMHYRIKLYANTHTHTTRSNFVCIIMRYNWHSYLLANCGHIICIICMQRVLAPARIQSSAVRVRSGIPEEIHNVSCGRWISNGWANKMCSSQKL